MLVQKRTLRATKVWSLFVQSSQSSTLDTTPRELQLTFFYLLYCVRNLIIQHRCRKKFEPHLTFVYVWFGWVLWIINHCRSFNVKSCLYIYIEYICFDLHESYGISTIVGYLMPNPVHIYILNMYIWYDLVGFYGISTIVGYLMPNPIYTYILNMYIWYDLVGFYGISTIVGHLMSNPVYTYILNIYALICLGFMAYQPL